MLIAGVIDLSAQHPIDTRLEKAVGSTSFSQYKNLLAVRPNQ